MEVAEGDKPSKLGGRERAFYSVGGRNEVEGGIWGFGKDFDVTGGVA